MSPFCTALTLLNKSFPDSVKQIAFTSSSIDFCSNLRFVSLQMKDSQPKPTSDDYLPWAPHYLAAHIQQAFHPFHRSQFCRISLLGNSLTARRMTIFFQPLLNTTSRADTLFVHDIVPLIHNDFPSHWNSCTAVSLPVLLLRFAMELLTSIPSSAHPTPSPFSCNLILVQCPYPSLSTSLPSPKPGCMVGWSPCSSSFFLDHSVRRARNLAKLCSFSCEWNWWGSRRRDEEADFLNRDEEASDDSRFGVWEREE